MRKIKQLMARKTDFRTVLLFLGTASKSFCRKSSTPGEGVGVFARDISVEFFQRRKPPRNSVSPIPEVKEIGMALEGIIHIEKKRISEQIPNPVGIDAAIRNRFFPRSGVFRRRRASTL